MKEVGVKLKVGATGLEQIDKLTSGLNAAGVSTTALDGKAAELAAELKKLGEQQALIDQFERTKTAVGAADAAMQAAKQEAGALARQLGESKAAVAQQRAAFEASGAASRALGTDLDAQKTRVAQLVAETRRLGNDQGLIDQFKRQKLAVADSAAAMQAAKDRAAELGRALSATEAPSRAQQVAFDRARASARAADDAYTSQRLTLQNLRGQMSAAGIASDDLAGAQVRVRRDIEQASTGLAGAREELKRLTVQQQAAKDQTGQLAREMKAAEGAIAGQEKAFAKARSTARDADAAYTAQRLTLQNLRTQMAAAGVSADGLADAQRRVKAELAQAQANMRATADWAQRLATAERAAATQGTALAGASADTSAALRQTAAAAREVVSPLDSVGKTLRNVATVGVAGILGSETAQMLRSVAETADAYSNLQARIKLVTGEGAAFTSAMEGISEIALQTNSNLENTGTLFSRIAESGRAIGLGQEQSLAITKSINQAIQLSGASAASSDAAITQLIQGLQSGVVRGEEFNSIMEQAPRLATALADGLGVAKGELRALAEQGKLTTDVVIRALQSQAATLEKEFGSLPATVGRAIENLSTRWKLFIGDLNSASGATATVAGGIDSLANNLDELAGIATRAGTVLVAALAVQAAGALRGLALQMAATGASAGLLTKNLNDIPKAINIVVAAVGFEVGFQIGEMLRENSALARKLGVGITEFLVGVVNDLQFLKEAAAAVFTDDTVGAAFDRFKARAEEQRAIFQGLYEDAEQSPEVVRAAAAAAAAETEKLGTKAATAGAQVAAAGAAGAAGLASTTAAAETASGALQGLVTAAAAANKAVTQAGAEAARQADALVKLALAGGRAAETFRVELPEAIAKLSGPELEQFRVAMTQRLAEARTEAQRLGDQLQAAGKDGSKAFAQAEQAARLLTQVAVEVGTRAAEALGVDLVAAGGRLSKEFAAAQDNLALLIRSMPALRTAGVDASDAVARAIGKMIDGAKSQAEIDALVTRLQALGKAGQLSGDQVADGLKKAGLQAKQLRQDLDDVLPGINSIDEAVRLMGIETRATLEAAAQNFAQAWARIQNSTDITLSEKIKAFNRFRDAAIAANDGVESSELALQRQTLQTKAEVAGLGAEFERSMGTADAAVGRTTRLVNELGEEVNEAGERINQAAAGFGRLTEEALKAENAALRYGSAIKSTQYDSDRFALGSDGQRFTAGGQLTPPDNSGNWEFKGDVRANNLNGPAGSVAVKGQGWWVPKNGSGGGSSALLGGAGSTGSGGFGERTTAPVARPSSVESAAAAPVATTRTLFLEIGGGRRVSYQANSDAEAARVEGLLNTLASEARRAGL
jgi:tape measure domain-containing protein